MFLVMEKMRNHKHLVDADSARDAGKPIPVALYAVEKTALKPSVVGSCVTEASQTLIISSAIRDSVVSKVKAKVGAYLKAGEELVNLDDREKRSVVGRASKRVLWLEYTLDERKHLMDYFYENLSKGQSLEVDYRRAKIDWLKESSDLDKAKEDLRLAEIDLEKMMIKAPVSGLVDEIIAEGQVALQNMSIAKMSVVDPLHLSCNFDVNDYSYVTSLLDRGEVSLRGMPGVQLPARFVKRQASQNGRTLNWVFSVDNSDRDIYPAMVGYIRFQSDSAVVRLPTVALLNRLDKQAQVFVANPDNIALLTTVILGQQSGGYTEIVSGLGIGDKVVVAGQKDLVDGDKVSDLDPTEVVYSYGN